MPIENIFPGNRKLEAHQVQARLQPGLHRYSNVTVLDVERHSIPGAQLKPSWLLVGLLTGGQVMSCMQALCLCKHWEAAEHAKLGMQAITVNLVLWNQMCC